MLGLTFLDMDAVIEEQRGKSIPAIFRDEGEAHFRALETALLRYLLHEQAPGVSAPIISTGGGVVLRKENRDMLRQLGFCVWLNVEVPTLLARTARTNNRPLLANTDRRAMLEKLSAQRSPLYAQTAHLPLDSTHLDILAVTRRIARAAQEFFPDCPELSNDYGIRGGIDA